MYSIFPSLLVMNRQLLNAKKSWMFIEDMHCQFVAFHTKCQLELQILNLNPYPPKLKTSQTLKLPPGYV